MKAIPLVRANSILPIVKFLEQLGTPTERLIREAKLPLSMLEDPETLISLYHGFAFLEKVAHCEGIEHLGILVNQQTQITDLGIFSKILCQSLTLYDLLNTISVLLTTTYNSGARVWLTDKDDQVWLNHQYFNPAKVNNQQAQYYASLKYLKIIQLLMGTQWYPIALHFQADQLSGLDDIELFSHTRVYFQQPNNAIAFPKSLLTLPLQHRINSNLCYQQQTYEILQSSAPATDFTTSLRQLIREHLKGGYPDVKLAAEAAGMSTRTLQRRLAQEGLNYSRLVEQVRFDLAMILLQYATLQLNDIASELGYTEPANFTRSFKRWVGISPRGFRHFYKDSSQE